MTSKVLKSDVLPILKPVSRLIGYNMTPQVTGFEYKEVRQFQKKVAKHPDKLSYYMEQIKGTVKARQLRDKGII